MKQMWHQETPNFSGSTNRYGFRWFLESRRTKVTETGERIFIDKTKMMKYKADDYKINARRLFLFWDKGAVSARSFYRA